MTIKTDKSLKRAAQKTADELGFSLGTLVNAFLKQFVRTKEVNFSMERFVPNAKTTRLLKMIMKDMKTGKNTTGTFTDVDKMDAYLKRL